eukprot:CCRYP_013541-RA/>CCRYP_013541-RA protein AED:0.05 eAED:0.05 QI:0/-1/0/1/-1/1/1/0/1054
MMRGITNTSQTACHTSSSLQLLYHCFPLLRRALLELASIASRERRRQQRRKAKECPKGEHGQTSEQDDNNEWDSELVYQLSWFFLLLAEGQRHNDDDSHDPSAIHDGNKSLGAHSNYSSPKILVRKQMKQPLTPTQKRAVQDFMKSSQRGRGDNGDEDWRKLVSAMREYNRATYDNVLGKVLGGDTMTLSKPDKGSLSRSAVDPTAFYQHLTTYTSSLSESHPIVMPIHPSMVGDASSVFRSLCHALEYSVNGEYERVRSQCEMMEVEQWNNDGRGVGGSEEKQLRRLERWRDALEKVAEAMKVEWKGALLSRIVGTCSINESADWKSKEQEAASKSSDKGRITTTTLRRTKKNGNIERPIPIPFPLPVIQQNSLSQQHSPPSENQRVETGRQYFPSLISSLYSVTIEPNPIRGYDWRGLMKRGEVLEEKLVQHIDGAAEQEILEDGALKHEKKHMHPEGSEGVQNNEKNKKKVHLDGLAVVQEAQEMRKSKDDNTSVASRSIGVQTDFSETEGDAILIPRGFIGQDNHHGNNGNAESTSKQKELETMDPADDAKIKQEPPPPSPPARDTKPPMRKHNNFVEKNALYAAAVAAINSSSTKRRGSRVSLRKNTARNTYASSPDTGSFSGIEVGGASNATTNISPMEVGPGLIVKNVNVSPSSSGSVESRLSSDTESVEESTVNSKVSSVNTHSSNDHDDGHDSSTHSSDIDTPSDIDELSLGSFTASEDDATKGIAEPTIPMLDDETNCIKSVVLSDHEDLSDRTNPIASVDINQSTRSSPSNVSETVDSDGSSTSTDDSSTSSSDTSSTDSSDTSEEESSSSDENLSNNLSESFTPEKDEPSDRIGNKQEWVTRKETRFCHPLPQNLIFHLKRFEYSNALGRVDNLAGELHIPNEFDLKPCCLDPSGQTIDNVELKDCCYRYSLNGAIVHVDPLEDEAEKVYGEALEGHYVTFINASASVHQETSGIIDKKWYEIDDDKVRPVDEHVSNILGEDNKQSMSDKQLALQILSGCDFMTSKAGSCSGVERNDVKERERRYATLVVYSRSCDCFRSRM